MQQNCIRNAGKNILTGLIQKIIWCINDMHGNSTCCICKTELFSSAVDIRWWTDQLNGTFCDVPTSNFGNMLSLKCNYNRHPIRCLILENWPINVSPDSLLKYSKKDSQLERCRGVEKGADALSCRIDIEEFTKYESGFLFIEEAICGKESTSRT